MERNFFRFVWRYSRREQLLILFLTALSFPLVYVSLELPKIIVNDAIEGRDFPRTVLGLEFEQVPYLLLLCAAFLGMVVLINAVKWFLNVTIGMTGERMLRRLRFMLFEHVLRYPMSRFRTTRPGEVIQSMLGEIEPLGGFIGEVIATPAFQGGLLGVYLLFIFVQDFWLGLAAVALYPAQAYLIPKLQAKVVRLNKARAANTRVLAETIAESLDNIQEIRTNATARWHLAQVSERLFTNTRLRLALFKRKFTIKFINNFMNQLTPFFFYSIGGYLVIRGELDFGSLVAVLATYKDLAGPWKAVLNYVQRWNDFNARYEFVVDAFMADDVRPPEYIHDAKAQKLPGEIGFESVEGGPGTGGLTVPRLEIRAGAAVAVVGGEDGAREAFLRLVAGLIEPATGRITIAGRRIDALTLAELGATVGFVSAEPGLLSGSIRDNVVYGLLRNMPDLAEQSTAEAVERLREARRTGNLTADAHGDWIDYEAAGVDGPEALERRILELVERVGLADDLAAGALDSRVDPAEAERWAGPVIAARRKLAAALEDEQLADLVEPWVADRFNSNGTLLANVLFGLPVEPAEDMLGYARQPLVGEALAHSGARAELLAIGRDIAGEFAELVETVGRDSAVLESFPGYSKAQILAARELVHDSAGRAPEAMTAEQQETLLVLALGFVEARDRLEVLDAGRITRLLGCRRRVRAGFAGRPEIVFFDEDRFNPGRTIAENILNAQRRYDRRARWRRLDELMAAAIRAAGLRDDLVRLGLGAPVGSGGANLSSRARRRVALARALLKRPNILLLEGIAATAGTEDAGLRRMIRRDLPAATLIHAADEDATSEADLVLHIDADGVLRADVETPTRRRGRNDEGEMPQ